IVVWVSSGSSLVLNQNMDVFKDTSIRRIAIANPKLAPYGKAAVAALTSKGLYDKVEGKLVFGENVSQTAQFVESGNADIGVLALSHVVAPAMQGKGRYFTVPAELYPPIDQGVVVVKASG